MLLETVLCGVFFLSYSHEIRIKGHFLYRYMGCKIFRPLFGGQDGECREELDEEPKVYSWEARKKNINVADFIVDSKVGETVVRLPGSVNGQQFIIKDCTDCEIYVFDHCATVTIDDCQGCKIVLGAVKSSVFIRDCNSCVLVSACQQFRTRDCKRIDSFLCCTTQPIVEASTGMKFGCLQLNYKDFKNHLSAAGISPFTNHWSSIYDFTPVPGEVNYTLLNKVNISELLPSVHQAGSVISVTTDSDRSIIPYTVGNGQRQSGSTCLIAIFWSESQLDQAFQVVGSLRNHELIQTSSLNLSIEQAQQLFLSNQYNDKVTKGAVIILEYNTTELDTCQTVARSMNTQHNMYISEDNATAEQQLNNLTSLSEMQMKI